MDGWIKLFLESGKTEEETSHILSEVTYQSILELYTSKTHTEEEKVDKERLLQKLLDSNAQKDELFAVLEITPDELREKIHRKLAQIL